MSQEYDLSDLYDAAIEELYFELNRYPTPDEIRDRVSLYQQKSEAYALNQMD